jgi:hypothetical protein
VAALAGPVGVVFKALEVHNDLRSRDSQGGGATAAAGGNNTASPDFAKHIDHQNCFQLQLRQL